MSSVAKRSFKVNLITLRILGLYPPRTESLPYLIYAYTALVFGLLTDPFLNLLFFLNVEEANVLNGGFSLFLATAMPFFIPKYLPFIVKRKQIRDCIYFIQNNSSTFSNEKQQKMLEECIWVCRRNSIFFTVCLIIDEILWGGRPIILNSGELPMEIWLPFDPKANWMVFWLFYAILVYGVAYMGMGCAAVDPLVAGLAYHAAGQIMILKDSLQHLYEYTNNDDVANKINEDSVERKNVYEEIKKCVDHHKIILYYVKLLEDCFSIVVFGQFFASIPLIGFCFLQLKYLDMSDPNFSITAFYLFTILIQLYFYCYYGTTLHEESKTINTAVYLGRWFDYDEKSKKALIILMNRANPELTVTAGKIFELSLATFMKILKGAYSLLTVFKDI